MKKILALLITLFSLNSFSQAPTIEWQKCLGGSDFEPMFGNTQNHIQKTQDGGYVILSSTKSIDGDVSNFLGGTVTGTCGGGGDIWVIKLSHDGILEWEVCVGGLSACDNGHTIIQTSDNGFIVLGQTNSSELPNFHAQVDVLLTKLNSNGNIQWQRCYGGSGGDWVPYNVNTSLSSNSLIQEIENVGYLFGFQSFSTNGDVQLNYGGHDIILMLVDFNGSIVNQKVVGGLGSECPYYIVKCNDNSGFLIGGDTNSSDSFFNGNLGNNDFFILKIDNSLNVQWIKCLGSSGSDCLGSFYEDSSGQIVVSGIVMNSNSLGSGTQGDVVVYKLDTFGNTIFRKEYGGSDDEGGFVTSSHPYSSKIFPMGEDLIFATISTSTDGDVSSHFGDPYIPDYWIVKTDSNGNIIWDRTFGSENYDDRISDLIIHDNLDVSFGIEIPSNTGNLFHPNFHDTLLGEYPDIGLIRIDSAGNQLFYECFGGASYETLGNILFDESINQYTICGSTWSNDGDVSGNHGGQDIWILKLSEDLSVEDLNQYSSNKKLIKIFDLTGREVSPTPNQLLIYQYDDGTTEKRMIVK